ncbi:hypothetical protein EAG18_18200 [Pseudoalteromonas sp. J010]|uniref:hypothetical protein n=1 Tax=Pseudoalteromonas sp. J010 TaxID=998465 RepID=UPI000F64C45C|nr:hypothetical protein [Pseudoalteromonas sp. J010]RRS07189.1 hypothetical protein EAG18_18200 [Pseudoalteromonas sp. J010]
MITSKRNMKKTGITNKAIFSNNNKYLHRREVKRVKGESHDKALKCYRLELNTQQVQTPQMLNLHQLRTIAGGSGGLLKKDPKIR